MDDLGNMSALVTALVAAGFAFIKAIAAIIKAAKSRKGV